MQRKCTHTNSPSAECTELFQVSVTAVIRFVLDFLMRTVLSGCRVSTEFTKVNFCCAVAIIQSTCVWVSVRALMRTNFLLARHRHCCGVWTQPESNSYHHPQYIFHILSISSHVFFFFFCSSSSDSFDFLCTTRLKSSNQIHFERNLFWCCCS